STLGARATRAPGGSRSGLAGAAVPQPETAGLAVAGGWAVEVRRGAGAGMGAGVDEHEHGLLLARGRARAEPEVADAELGARGHGRRVDRDAGRRLRRPAAGRRCWRPPPSGTAPSSPGRTRRIP